MGTQATTTRNARPLAWAILGIVTIAAGFFGFKALQSKLQDIRISEAFVQEKLNKQMDRKVPLKGKGRFMIKSVTPKSVKVEFNADGTVSTLAEVVGQIAFIRKNFTVVVRANGTPYYDEREKALYVRPGSFRVESFQYEGEPPAEMAERAIDRYLTNPGLQRLLRDGIPRAEEILNDIAERVATRTLERKAVYTPKDDLKGWVMKASLQSIQVGAQVLILKFSLVTLGLTALFIGIVILIAIGLAIALIRKPEALVAISMLPPWG